MACVSAAEKKKAVCEHAAIVFQLSHGAGRPSLMSWA